MAFKAAGAPCDLMRENILLNSGSYSTTANTDSGEFRTDAITMGMPARLTHTIDATAYTAGGPPKTDSWLSRCRWGWSPANLNSDGQAGALVQLGDGFFRVKHVAATGVASISISNDAILHGIVFNQLATNAVTASTGLVTIYNGTTTAASTDASVVGIIGVTAGIPEFIYDAIFPAGITLQVGSGVTPLDISVVFR